MKKSSHVPVLMQEVLSFFEGREIRVFFDGTLGAGGHAEAMLERHPEIECYIGCDQDPSALILSQERLSKWKDKVSFVHGNFRHLDEILQEKGIAEVDGFFLTSECRLCSSIKEKRDLVFYEKGLWI